MCPDLSRVVSREMVEAAGIETDAHGVSRSYDSGRSPGVSVQKSTYSGQSLGVEAPPSMQNRAFPEHSPGDSERSERATSVHP